MTGTDIAPTSPPQEDPALAASTQWQDPQASSDPESPRARLDRMIESRKKIISDQWNKDWGPAMAKGQAVPQMDDDQLEAAAFKDIAGRFNDPLARNDFLTFLKTGARTHGVAAWMGQGGTDDPTNPEFYATQQQHNLLRDWIAEPIVRLPAAIGQQAANLSYGIARLLGSDKSTPDVETSWIAIAKSIGSKKTYDQVYAEEAARMKSYEGGRGLEAIPQIGATGLGTVLGLGVNPALKAGSTAGQWIVGAAGKIAENPILMGKVGRFIGGSAGAFGALQFLEQQPGEDKSTFQSRMDGLVAGVVTGPLYELGSAGGKAAFYRIMQGAGKEAQGVSKAVAGWARETGVERLPDETTGKFFIRAMNGWIDAGTPGLEGAGINARKAAALGAQAMIEALGFSAIDANFRKDFVAAFLQGDKDAWGRMAVDLAGNALGMFALRAGGRLGNIPQIQREMLDPAEGRRTQFRPEPPPAGEAPKPVEQPPPSPAEDLYLKNHLWRYGWTMERAKPPEPAPAEAPPKTGMLALARQRFELPDFPQDPVAAKERALRDLYLRNQRGYAPSTESLKTEPSTYWFEVTGDEGKPSPALREALGLPETMPAKDLTAILEKASLVSALHSKAALPGQEVSVEGVHGEGDTLRTIRYGVVHEREASPSSKWLPAESSPMRPRDVLEQPQQMAVDELTSAAATRSDLPPQDQILLGATIGTLGKVAAERDPSIAEAMPMLPELTQTIRTGTPEEAAQAIKTAAELMTSKSPKAIKAEQKFLAEQQAKAKEAAAAGPESTGAIRNLPESAASEPSPQPAQTTPGSETPAGESATAGGGSKAAEEPLPPMFMHSGGIPPELARAAQDIAVGSAKGLGGLISDAYGANYRDLIVRAEKAGAPADFVQKSYKADTNARKFDARFNKAGLRDYEKEVRQTRTGATKPEIAEQLEYLTKGNTRTTVFAAHLDEHLGNYFGAESTSLSTKAQEINDTAHKLIVEAAKIAHEHGLGFVNAKGGLTGSMDVYRLPRQVMPEARRAMADPRSPVHQAVKDWLLAEGYKPKEVDSFLHIENVMRVDATEQKRFIKVLPSQFELPDGSWFRIWEDRPRAVPRLLHNSATVLGARSVFHDTPEALAKLTPEQKAAYGDIPESMKATLADAAKSVSPQALAAMKDVSKALHGMPIEDARTYLKSLPVGTNRESVVRSVGAILNLSRAGHLTMAWVNHVTSYLQHSGHIGPVRLAKAWGDLGNAMLHLEAGDLKSRLIGEGFLSSHVDARNTWGESKTETLENIAHRVGHTLTAPLEMAVDTFRVVLARGAELALEDMRAGHGSQSDRSLLTAMNFKPEQIARMLKGEGTDAEYDRYKTHAVSTLELGGGDTSVSKSFAQHKGVDRHIWFQSMFRKRVQVVASYGNEMANAQGPAEKALVGAKIVNYLMLSSVGGFAAQIVKKWLKGEGFTDWLRETAQDPVEAIRTVLFAGLLGGGGEVMYEAAKGIVEGISKGEILGNVFGGLLGPAGATVDAAQFLASWLGADIHGYENMTRLQKFGKFVRMNIPAAQQVHRGMFGQAALALTERPPELANAKDAFFRWEEKQGPINPPPPRKPERVEWLDAMRTVVDKVDAGGQWGDNELMDALAGAGIFGETKNSVADSLRAKKVFKGELDPRSKTAFNPDKYDSLVSYLGDKHYDVLKSYDDTLEYLAKRLVARNKR